jgi:hypothetical protein
MSQYILEGWSIANQIDSEANADMLDTFAIMWAMMTPKKRQELKIAIEKRREKRLAEIRKLT